MTNTVRLYNSEEVQAIVESAIAETLAVAITTNKEAARALKREQKRAYKKNKITCYIKELFVLGIPAWGCMAMIIYWLSFGY